MYVAFRSAYQRSLLYLNHHSVSRVWTWEAIRNMVGGLYVCLVLCVLFERFRAFYWNCSVGHDDGGEWLLVGATILASYHTSVLAKQQCVLAVGCGLE